MQALFIVGLSSLAVCWLLTPLIRDFFGFLEMVDQPDEIRKLHRRPIPRVGGIPLAISYFGVLFAVLVAASFWKELHDESGPSIVLLTRLLPAMLIVFVTGLLDDFRGLTPAQKLGGQIFAAAWAVWAGVRLAPLEGHPEMDLWLLPLSALWLVFCTNAINLIDGLDGLASGVALLASAGLLLAALLHNHPVLALATVPLVGGLIGFLCYNFSPATIFLGDCGSLLIGFLLGCFGLMWNQQAASGLGRYAPLLAMAVPAAEVGISVFRRFLRQQPIFSADRNHIHHRLLSLGLTARNATFILYAVTALCVTSFLLETIIRPQAATILAVLFITGALIGIRLLRYTEFRTASRCLFGGEFRRVLRMRICLKDFEESLSRARGVDECWKALREAVAAAGFVQVWLEIDGRKLEFRNNSRPLRGLRRINVPLPNGEIVFEYETAPGAAALWVAPIAEALEEALQRTRPETRTTPEVATAQ